MGKIPTASTVTDESKEKENSLLNISLRDYFAGQAMAAMLSATGNVCDMGCDERANYACMNADALIVILASGHTVDSSDYLKTLALRIKKGSTL